MFSGLAMTGAAERRKMFGPPPASCRGAGGLFSVIFDFFDMLLCSWKFGDGRVFYPGMFGIIIISLRSKSLGETVEVRSQPDQRSACGKTHGVAIV